VATQQETGKANMTSDLEREQVFRRPQNHVQVQLLMGIQENGESEMALVKPSEPVPNLVIRLFFVGIDAVK